MALRLNLCKRGKFRLLCCICDPSSIMRHLQGPARLWFCLSTKPIAFWRSFCSTLHTCFLLHSCSVKCDPHVFFSILASEVWSDHSNGQRDCQALPGQCQVWIWGGVVLWPFDWLTRWNEHQDLSTCSSCWLLNHTHTKIKKIKEINVGPWASRTPRVQIEVNLQYVLKWTCGHQQWQQIIYYLLSRFQVHTVGYKEDEEVHTVDPTAKFPVQSRFKTIKSCSDRGIQTQISKT